MSCSQFEQAGDPEDIDLLELEIVDEVGAHFLYRSYLNELVILMERLQRLIELIEIGYGAKAFTESCDLEVLRFFNPVLSKKRNHNHHNLYLGYARSQGVEQAALAGRAKGDQAAARKLFSEVIGKELRWMDRTEDAFAVFLPSFFEKVHGYLRKKASYADPIELPKDFMITTRLERTLRKKYRHEEEFGRPGDRGR